MEFVSCPRGYKLSGYVGPNPQAFVEILKEQRELQENCRLLCRYFFLFNKASSRALFCMNSVMCEVAHIVTVTGLHG